MRVIKVLAWNSQRRVHKLAIINELQVEAQEIIALPATINMPLLKRPPMRPDLKKEINPANQHLQKQIQTTLLLNPKFLPLQLHHPQPAPQAPQILQIIHLPRLPPRMYPPRQVSFEFASFVDV
jgi:hypothetical protein